MANLHNFEFIGLTKVDKTRTGKEKIEVHSYSIYMFYKDSMGPPYLRYINYRVSKFKKHSHSPIFQTRLWKHIIGVLSKNNAIFLKDLLEQLLIINDTV